MDQAPLVSLHLVPCLNPTPPPSPLPLPQVTTSVTPATSVSGPQATADAFARGSKISATRVRARPRHCNASWCLLLSCFPPAAPHSTARSPPSRPPRPPPAGQHHVPGHCPERRQLRRGSRLLGRLLLAGGRPLLPLLQHRAGKRLWGNGSREQAVCALPCMALPSSSDPFLPLLTPPLRRPTPPPAPTRPLGPPPARPSTSPPATMASTSRRL